VSTSYTRNLKQEDRFDYFRSKPQPPLVCLWLCTISLRRRGGMSTGSTAHASGRDFGPCTRLAFRVLAICCSSCVYPSTGSVQKACCTLSRAGFELYPCPACGLVASRSQIGGQASVPAASGAGTRGPGEFSGWAMISSIPDKRFQASLGLCGDLFRHAWRQVRQDVDQLITLFHMLTIISRAGVSQS
jgi:hypothetical protein